MSGFSDNPELASEAGRLGGESLKKKVAGTSYYADIGRKGGETVRKRYGNDFYAQIGKKGGESRGASARAKRPPVDPNAPKRPVGRPRKVVRDETS